MNKTYRNLLLVVAVGGLATARPALSQNPEDLPDPLLLRVPDGMTAVVTARRVKPLSDAEANDPIRQSWSPDLVSASISRRGKDLIILQTWEGEKKSAVVSSGSQVLYQPSLRYPEDVQINGAGAPDLSRGDFPWLAWIDRDLFVGNEQISGQMAYKFSRTPPENESIREKRQAAAEAAADAAATLKPEFRQAFIDSFLANDRREDLAWLDPRSLLPVISTDGVMEYTYSYRRTTPTDTEIPPEFRRAVEAARQSGP